MPKKSIHPIQTQRLGNSHISNMIKNSQTLNVKKSKSKTLKAKLINLNAKKHFHSIVNISACFAMPEAKNSSVHKGAHKLMIGCFQSMSKT